MSKVRRLTVLCLSLTVVGSCHSSVPATGAGEVRNPAPSATSLVHATEIRRLGRSEGSGPEIFGRLSYIAVDGDNRLYVADGMAQEIRVFDENGRFTRSLGNKGEGPGQFLDMLGLAFDSVGFAWVWDYRQQRLSVFDTAGLFVRSVQRQWRSSITPWPGQFRVDGSLLDIRVEYRGLDPSDRRTRRFESAVRAFRFDQQLRQVDSLPALAVLRTAFAGNYIVPFEGGLVWAFEPDGSSWSAHGSDYRVLRTNARGDTVFTFSLDVPQVPVTAAERDSAVHTMRLPPDVPPIDVEFIPRAKPAIVRLVRLAPGWVGVFPQLGPDTGRYMDVFTPDGTHRSRVDLGVRLVLSGPAPCAGNGLLFGVTTGDFDVQYVVVLDLRIPELRN